MLISIENNTCMNLGLSQVQMIEQNQIQSDQANDNFDNLQNQYRELQNKLTEKKCYNCSRFIETQVSRQTSPLRTSSQKLSRQTSITPRSVGSRKQHSQSPIRQDSFTHSMQKRSISKSPKQERKAVASTQTQEFYNEQGVNNQSFNTYSSPERINNNLSINGSPQNKQIDDLLQQSFSSQAPMSNEQLNNIVKYLNSNKTDESQLNNMIDGEKIFIIQKYEGLLQKIIAEYNKLQRKNEGITSQIMNESRSAQSQYYVIKAKDSQIKQMSVRISELEHKNQVNNKEIQGLRSKIQSDQDTNFAEKKHLEMAKQQLMNQVSQLQDSENNLRSRNAQIQEDSHQMEYQVKQLKEQSIKIETEKRVFEMELQKTRVQEQNFAQEILRTRQLNQDLEVKQSEYRNQLEALVITLKRKDQEFEQVQWNNQGLKSSVDILHKNQQAILVKNNKLKEELNRCQVEKQSYQDSTLNSKQTQRSQAQSNERQANVYNQSYEYDAGKSHGVSPKVSFNSQIGDYYKQASPKNLASRNDDGFQQMQNQNIGNSLEASILKYLPKSPINLRGNIDSNLSLNTSVFDKRFVTNDSTSINNVFKWPDAKSSNSVQFRNDQCSQPTSNFNSFSVSAVRRHQIDLGNLTSSAVNENLSARNHYNTAQHSKQRSISVNSDAEALPPAGKKSGLHSKMLQSHQNINSIVNQLQNAMIEQLLQKTEMEQDLKTFTAIHPKTRDIIERKQELEINLEIVIKNIQNLKDKIKLLD